MEEGDPLCDFDYVTDVPSDLQCGICQELVRDPVVTEECGHLFCEECLAKAASLSTACPICRREKYTTRKDHRAKRQSEGLEVKCNYKGCVWVGGYSAVFKHQALCEHRPVYCSYKEFGCVEPMEAAAPVHEQTHVAAHLKMVCAELLRMKQGMAGVEEREAATRRDRAALWEELAATRDALRQEREEKEALHRAYEQDLQSLRHELLELRLHMNSRSLPAPSAAPLTWVSPTDASPRLSPTPFVLSDGGTAATLSVPGWSTLRCSRAYSSARASWFFRITADEAFQPSTVMIGVTANCHAGSTHLGNTPEARCFQANGFRWDGLQCFSYGEECKLDDVVGVHLDFDAHTIRFSRNGQCMGPAFDDLGGLVYPAASLCSKGHGLKIERTVKEAP
eukprot:TRINITY_DN16335_c0_g2_i1.p1 TRINITY_DN16335_c0_g2~~TRINITY_DN16335_c0_g2_i1.p1  ORF type:complete len:415 (+),score=103.62 TRINITY_DN16335_c0_g2_i1:65-1246(+)